MARLKRTSKRRRISRAPVCLTAFLLAGCEFPVMPAVIDDHGHVETDSTDIVIDWERPYPIHIEWLFCQWDPRKCRPLDIATEMVPRGEYGIRQSTTEWARILAPTPVPDAPVATRSFQCYGGPRVEEGTALPSGITIQIIVSDKDADQVGGGTCYHNIDERGAPVMVIMHMYTLRALEVERERFIWRNMAMHETGHGLQSGRRWQSSMVVATDSSHAWVTDSAFVAAFNALGGDDFEGPKVLTDWPWCNGCHWHTCIAPNDVMATVWYPYVEITNLTLSSLHEGLLAHPQADTLYTTRRHECPNGTGGSENRNPFTWERSPPDRQMEDGKGAPSF